MNPKIIAERGSTIILFNDGKVNTVPNNLYNQLKYREFNGNRISYVFVKDEMHVQETYTEGIFNCYFNGEVLNIRDTTSLILSIKKHRETNNTNEYESLFKRQYFHEKKEEIMNEMIKVFGDRVKTQYTDNKHKDVIYIIDDRFMVNDRGVSYYKTDTGNWSFLCTVAEGNMSSMTFKTKIGEIKLGETELTIMGKIGFLLYPDIHDTVFFEQLPDRLKQVIKDEIKAETKIIQGV